MCKIYITNKGKLFYEGQKLSSYDRHGNFIENVKINKFIIRYSRNHKCKWIYVNISSLKYKTKNLTIDIDNLEKYYREYKDYEE